jgi:hypothetical protein
MANQHRDLLYNLHLSKNKEVVIKIKLRHQNDPILTTVEDVVNDIIVVKAVNLHGVSLPRTSFYIDEIESAKCMRVLYNAPLYVKLRTIKANIRDMQGRFASLSGEKIEIV